MKNLNIFLFLCVSLFMTNCCNGPACGGDTYLSPLVKYKGFPMKKCLNYKAAQSDIDFGEYGGKLEPVLYRYFRFSRFHSYFGIISNSYYPYMDDNSHIVYWVSNQVTNKFCSLKWNDRFIHANRRYVAYRNVDMLYVVDTNGNTNWSHNVSYKSYILRLANGDSPIFVYGEFDKTHQNDEGSYDLFRADIKHQTYLYNMNTKETTSLGIVQDILCFSPNNKYLFYNAYIGIAYEYYWRHGEIFLTNCGPLSVFDLNQKKCFSIGNHWIESNSVSSQYCDQVIGITSDLKKFYLFEFAYEYPNDRWTNENGQTVTNIDGVWEIDISSLGLKDE